MAEKKKSVFITTASVTADTVPLCSEALIQVFIFLVAVASSKMSLNGLDAI